MQLSLLAAALSGPFAAPWVNAATDNDVARASEQAKQFFFVLAAQPLADALGALSRLTGQNIVYIDPAPYHLQAPALKGRFSTEEALDRLLAGTSLRYRRSATDTLTLTPVAVIATSASQGIQLQPLNIDSTLTDRYRPDASAPVSHTRQPWLEQPQAVSRVPAQVLSDQQPHNLDDALRHVSGLTQGNTLGSTQDTLIKRGFGDNRDGSILRDGMPVVQGRNFSATTESIEVLKGPTALLYGIQDPGGVINVISKTPQLTAQHALKSQLSSFGDGHNGSVGTLDTTGPIGSRGLAYRLIIDHQDEAYWRSYGAHRETLVAPSLAWYGDQDEIQLAYEQRSFITPFDRGTVIDPSTGHPLAIPYSRRLDEPFNNMTGRSQLARLSYRHQLNDDWQLRSAYGYNQETYDAYQVRVTDIDTAKGTLSRSMDGTLDSVSRDQQGQLELLGNRRLLGVQHEILIGLSDEHRLYFRGDLLRQNSLTTFSYLHPVYGREIAPTQVSAAASHQLDRLRSTALYLRDSVHLNDNWTATVGTRLLKYDQYAGRGEPFHANTDINGSAWVPSAGLVYRIAPQWSWYASYSESFKPNSSIAPLNAVTEQVIDSTIRPEQAKAWETGIKFEQADGLTANLALYDIHKRNVLVSELVDTLPVSRNAGRVRSRGLELEASGPLSERWDWMAAYALIDAQVTQDPTLQGKPLQNVPRQSASLYFSHDLGAVLGNDRLHIGGGPHYVGDRAGDPANSFRLPAYTVTDVFARYDTRFGTRKVQVQLNINNLFNRQYYPSSVSQYVVAVGDPRQVLVSTTLQF